MTRYEGTKYIRKQRVRTRRFRTLGRPRTQYLSTTGVLRLFLERQKSLAPRVGLICRVD